MIDTNTDELLTREQAAGLLNIDPHTLACWRSQGRGPALVKFGTGRSAAVRYRRSAIEAWLCDPASAEATAGERWREERRQAIAAKATSTAPPKRRRRSKAKA